mmetsp:Transcript_30412/g.76666  ORF Transcript_30412/g.76666 Transcript_30412/m.76666 type:complete len:183 (-) Transcript_30412:1716-2264(-)
MAIASMRVPVAAVCAKASASASIHPSRTVSRSSVNNHSRRGALLMGGAALVAAQGGARPAAAESVFIGKYDDPSHPGCRREIDAGGNVYGADPVPIKPGAPCQPGEPTTPWKLSAKIAPDDKTIAIDFDPIDEVKQGPVTGVWTGEGLQLPNGLWTKKKDPVTGAVAFRQSGADFCFPGSKK